MSRRTGPRMLTAVAVLTMVASVVAFAVVALLNVFVFDEYDAYGEVSIPGSATVHLPAGDVTVSFHTQLIGSTSGNGLPVPPLKYRIDGPAGVAEPQLTEDYGSTTTVNNDARVRIGYLHVETEGDYVIRVDGNVTAFLSPRLAFGHGSGYGHLTVICGVSFGIALLLLVLARVWSVAARRREVTVDQPQPTSYPPLASFPARRTEAVIPTDEGVRLEQLDTLARLRDSGALTQAEFDAEKKRVLDGL